MQHVVAVIRKLEQSSGRSKEVVLDQGDSEELRQFLLYCLDPFRTYGIKAFPVPDSESGTYSWTMWMRLFDQLARRELTGNAARAAIDGALRATRPDWQTLVIRVLTKDPGCGIHATTVNKVFKGLIPTFKVSLAQTLERHRLKYPVMVETKWDGKRVVALCPLGDEPVLYSRNGHIEYGYQHIRDELKQLVNQINCSMAFDGELMFGMFGDRKAKEHEAEFKIFDMMKLAQWENQLCDVHWKDRYESMCDLYMKYNFDSQYEHLHISVAEKVNSWEQIEAMYREVVNNGGEGLMIKDPRAFYQFKRGHHWMKLKPEESEDLTVTGYFEGEGKYVGMLGGIEVDFRGKTVRVGSGFADWQRKMWWNCRTELIGQTAEVLYTEVTPDGSLRFPRFKTFRDDK